MLIFMAQNHQLRLLPRDFDSPASVLAAVYASEKLKVWSKRQHDKRRILQGDQKIASRFGCRGKQGNRRTGYDEDDDDVAVGIGYFIGMGGEEHWGIEVVEDHSQLLPKQSSETFFGGRSWMNKFENYRAEWG
jgi:hypothetical protein